MTHLYRWPVGETVNTHAFHACIYGFEPRTGHHFKIHIDILSMFFLFIYLFLINVF